MLTLIRTAARNIGAGLFRGFLVGLALIGLGLIRALLVVITGHSVRGPTLADIRPLGFYVAGFSLAGGIVGALRPWLRRTLPRYVVFCVAGTIAVASIVAGGESHMEWDRVTFMILTPIGIILGLFGIYVVERYFGGAGLWHAQRAEQRPNER